MCKDNCSDENIPLASENDEEEYEVVLGNVNSIEGHTIPRNVLIDYIKFLGDSTTNESFISPAMAVKIIDFVYFLNHRTGVSNNTANDLVHDWYKEPINDKKVIAFNQRTKSINELLMYLERDCELKNVLKD